jgi:hypothetical protein
MSPETVLAIIETAAQKLFANQPNIFEFTSETGQTEWNLAHHLAVELHRLFSEFDCDLDVTKPNLGYRRPDIILHRRGTHDANFLVVEVKRDADPGELRADAAKVADYWFPPPLRYTFGAVIDLRSDKTCGVQLFHNE